MQRRLIFLCLCLSLLLVVPAFARDETPSVSVSDQVILNGKAVIDSVYSAGQGFVVIHIDNNGAPGRVAGYAPVAPGWTYNLEVPFDPTIATPTLYAMLHVDDHQVGTYEFGTVQGADSPVSVNGQVVTPAFNANIIDAHDQFVKGDQYVADAVTVTQDGWLVIHSDNNGAPGPVLGEERVLKGTSPNVAVDLAKDGRTEVLWPMLHVDDNTIGTYEFGTVAGADAPVTVRGVTATTPVWTVPHARVENQIVVKGDNAGSPNTSVAVESVLSQGPGWLVIHIDNNGAPGPVIGEVAVQDGLNLNLTVSNLDASKATPVLWPMLHVDTGTVGQYEFGTVAGADSPVTVDGNVVTFPINAAPSLTVHAQDPLPGEADGTIRVKVDEALMDAPGWLAIHTNNNGAPGPVIGTALLHAGSNKNVLVEVDQAKAGTQVFPMLHYDTNTIGTYEFGTVQGADSPISVGGQVVFTALPLSASGTPVTAVPATQAASSACTVAARGTSVNRRSAASTTASVVGQLSSTDTASVTGQTSNNGFVWFQLSDGSFVRSDVVTTSGDCTNVTAASSQPAAPTTAPQAAPTVQPPAATPETSS